MNHCVWQIDNSFAIVEPDKDVRVAVEKLAEYGLLSIDEESTPAATARCLIDWVLTPGCCRDSFDDALWDAFQDNRLDILKALEIGQQPPVNRREYWHHKHRQQLSKPGVNYWKWRGNPESHEICPELTMLLTLPEPSENACRVLECLAQGKDPFFKPEIKARTESEMFTSFVANMGKIGADADHKPEQKQAYRQAFAEWHIVALAQLGQDTLERIYKVVYGVNWIFPSELSLSGIVPSVCIRQDSKALGVDITKPQRALTPLGF